MSRKIFLFAFLLLMISNYCYGQYYRKHYIAPAPWQYWSTANQIVIGTLSTTPVQVTLKKSDGTLLTTLSVSLDNPVSYRFAGNANTVLRNVFDTTYNDRGLIVDATAPVLVNMRNIASDAAIGWTSLGVDNIKGNASLVSFGEEGLGVEFRLGYYRKSTGGLYEEAPVYSVMATENNTDIEVKQAIGVLTFTLNEGQSRLFKAPLGAYLKSNKAVVVNVGSWGDTPRLCGPGGVNGQDGTFDQVAPVHMLGTKYLVVRGEGAIPTTAQRNSFFGSEQSLIVATQNNTTVTIQNFTPAGVAMGAPITQMLVNEGDFYSFYHGDGLSLNSSSLIISDKEVIVYAGTAVECETDISTVLPIGGCAGSINIQTKKFINYNDLALPYVGFAIIEHPTEPVFINNQNLEDLTGVNRFQLGSSGFYMLVFNHLSIGTPENIILQSARPLTASLVQQGDGFSMSAFFSSFGQAANMPINLRQNDDCTVRIESTEESEEYEWFLDGNSISITDENFIDTTESGQYSVKVRRECGWSNRSLPLNVEVQPCTDLSIQKEVISQNDGEAVFLITITNNDENFSDKEVVVTDILPSGYTFLSSLASIGIYDSGTGVWEVGELEPQLSATLEIRVKINVEGEYLNSASVTGKNRDLVPDNNLDTAIVVLGKLLFTKQANDIEYNSIGQVVEYTILIKNIGDIVVDEIEVQDDNADMGSLLPSAINELKPGESVQIKAKHTITEEDFRAKKVVNQAVLAAKTLGVSLNKVSDDPTTLLVDDPTIIPIVYKADLDAIKDDKIIYYQPGQETIYSIVVENKGPGSAVDVVVEDLMPEGVEIMEWESTINTNGIGDLIDIIPMMHMGDKVTYSVRLTIPKTHKREFINIVKVTAADNIDPVVECSACTDINYQQVFIPKGISPNGDQINDYLDLSDYNITNIKIFNRLGTLVYSAGKYEKEWYGQLKSTNNLLPSGTYYYVVENIMKDIFTGWIYIQY